MKKLPRRFRKTRGRGQNHSPKLGMAIYKSTQGLKRRALSSSIPKVPCLGIGADAGGLSERCVINYLNALVIEDAA